MDGTPGGDAQLRVVIWSHCYECRYRRRWSGTVRQHQHRWAWSYHFVTVTGLAVYRRSAFMTWDRAIRSARKAYPRITRQLHESEVHNGHGDGVPGV